MKIIGSNNLFKVVSVILVVSSFLCWVLFFTDILKTKVTETRSETVDQILKDTRFITVTHKNYADEVRKHKKVITFFYKNSSPNMVNERCAQVFKTTQDDPNTKGITFIKIKKDGNVSDDIYSSFGFKGAPSLLIYVDGKNVFNSLGGPKDEKEKIAAIEGMKNNYKNLSSITN